MRIVRAAAELPRSDSLGLVPTMGAFHEGHLSLFRAARAENDVVVVSLFVNPAQFAAGEDLDRYPRNEERDAELAEGEGVDVLFVPPADEIYPEGFQTWVEVEELGSMLEGEHRPGHFRGVATVCLKLFNLVRPTRAYFGQKDAQQAAVIRRMVRDLDRPGRGPRLPDRPRRGRARALVAQRLPRRPRSARRRWPSRARSPQRTTARS